VSTSTQVVLAGIRDAPLSVDEVLAAVRDPRAGAVALFLGYVRDHDHGGAVRVLEYSCHPSAVTVVAAVSAEHRAEAFEVCRELVDGFKAGVPIWKHQVFRDGSDEWVGVP